MKWFMTFIRVVLVCCLAVANHSFAFSSMSIDTSKWMGQLSNSLPLNQIIMPGSHDAGMSQTRHCTFFVKPEWDQAQSLSIGEQENAGSRYFDIRVDYDHDLLITYHRTYGAGCSGEPLQDILDQTIAFLDAHKTETVILKFSHTRNDHSHHKQEIARRVVNFIMINPKYKNHLYTSTLGDISGVNLGSLRGKIVAVFEQSDFMDYINNSQGILGYNDFPYNNNFVFNVFDQFANTTDFSEMRADQLKKLGLNGGLGKHYLFLLSWTLTGSPLSFKLNLRELADKANPELASSLQQAFSASHLPKPNIVYLDFINSSLAKEIISYNFEQISPFSFTALPKGDA